MTYTTRGSRDQAEPLRKKVTMKESKKVNNVNPLPPRSEYHRKKDKNKKTKFKFKYPIIRLLMLIFILLLVLIGTYSKWAGRIGGSMDLPILNDPSPSHEDVIILNRGNE